MSVLAREINDLFNQIKVYDHYSYGMDRYFQTSSETEYTVEVPLLGVSKENVKVDVQDNILVVEACSGHSRYAKNFKQTWSLAKDSDVDNVSAKLENGVLTVKVPRFKPNKKTVTVNVV